MHQLQFNNKQKNRSEGISKSHCKYTSLKYTVEQSRTTQPFTTCIH